MVCRSCRLNTHNISCCDNHAINRSVYAINHGKDPVTNTEWLTNNTLQVPPGGNLIRKYFKEIATMMSTSQMLTWGHCDLPYIVYCFKSSKFKENAAEHEKTYVRAAYDSTRTLDIYVEIFDNDEGENIYNQYLRSKRQLKRDRRINRRMAERLQQDLDYSYLQRRTPTNTQIQDDISVFEQLNTENDINAFEELIGFLHDDINEVSYENVFSDEPIELPVSNIVIEAFECPICYNELCVTNKAILRCGHQFCCDCLFKNYHTENGTKCPCCRNKFLNF